MDRVYATGLFDYVEQPVAAALMNRMFDLVGPGGRLPLANFTPVIGFMEAMLEWYVISRTEAGMWALLDGIAPQASARARRDPSGCIEYLEVDRSR